MNIAGVHHVAIIASDYARSKQFYTDVVGLTVLAEHYRAERESWKCDLALDGAYLVELFSFPSPPQRVTRPEATGLRHLAFAVPSVADARDELVAKGVECEQIRVDSYTGKPTLFFFDPDHLPLELYEA